MTTTERDAKVTDMLEAAYTAAHAQDFDTPNTYRLQISKKWIEDINTIVGVSQKSYREMILVTIAGMMLDSNYRASKDLYACKPRALYEGPIKSWLDAHNIPCSKSGPLNIAKATVGLNKQWAAHRRPQKAAQAVLRILDYLEHNGSRDNVLKVLVNKLIDEALIYKSLAVEIDPTSDSTKIYQMIERLIKETPDGGNTPQRIAGLLLKVYHESMHTGVKVTGFNDSSYTTSTTSRKPGDINEESKDGTIYKVHEITIKPFDLKRIRDSFDTVAIYNESSKDPVQEIIVICRPEDMPCEAEPTGLVGWMGSYNYNGLSYQYWNIFEWIAMMLQRTPPNGRVSFHSALNAYIDHPSTAKPVKELWNILNAPNTQ